MLSGLALPMLLKLLLASLSICPPGGVGATFLSSVCWNIGSLMRGAHLQGLFFLTEFAGCYSMSQSRSLATNGASLGKMPLFDSGFLGLWWCAQAGENKHVLDWLWVRCLETTCRCLTESRGKAQAGGAVHHCQQGKKGSRSSVFVTY